MKLMVNLLQNLRAILRNYLEGIWEGKKMRRKNYVEVKIISIDITQISIMLATNTLIFHLDKLHMNLKDSNMKI